ncbi:hypothetical protein [Kitasatospora sp. NPDC098663]
MTRAEFLTAAEPLPRAEYGREGACLIRLSVVVQFPTICGFVSA